MTRKTKISHRTKVKNGDQPAEATDHIEDDDRHDQSNGKALMKTAKAALNDPLLHSLVSGLVIRAAVQHGAKTGLGNSVVAFASQRIARKSMPGALLVGAGFLAKNWYDKRKAKAAVSQEAQVNDTDLEADSTADQTKISEEDKSKT